MKRMLLKYSSYLFDIDHHYMVFPIRSCHVHQKFDLEVTNNFQFAVVFLDHAKVL